MTTAPFCRNFCSAACLRLRLRREEHNRLCAFHVTTVRGLHASAQGAQHRLGPRHVGALVLEELVELRVNEVAVDAETLRLGALPLDLGGLVGDVRDDDPGDRHAVDFDLALAAVGPEIKLAVVAFQGLGQALGLELHPLSAWRAVRVDVQGACGSSHGDSAELPPAPVRELKGLGQGEGAGVADDAA
eukprot:1865157-Pyramimonas_sp.AAC.2